MNNKLPVSIVISAYNEEKKIEECLTSVKWADEIIVVDNESTDNTAAIAKKHGATVLSRPNNLMLNVNKNYGFSKAKHEWILSLDADERATEEFRSEVAMLFQNEANMIDGYRIPRKNIIFGKWIQNSIWWPDYQVRFFKKHKGKFAEKHVHELVDVKGEVGTLTSPIIHLNYESVSQFLYKLDKIYTENEVKNFIASGKELHWFDAIRFPINDFLKTFFFQKGYKDGLHGLVLSMLQAFYSEVVFAKIWERQGFKEYNSKTFLADTTKEFNRVGNEIQYWLLTSAIDETKDVSSKLVSKIKRKIIASKLHE